MKRVVQIGPYPRLSGCIRGGVEASVYGLSQEQSLIVEVHVFDFPRVDGVNCVEYDKKVIVHRFRNVGKKQMLVALQVKAIVNEILALRPDVCHIHGTGLFSWLIYRKLIKKDIHVIVTIHGLILVEKRNALKKGFSAIKALQYLYQGWVERKFISQISVAIVDTEYVRKKVNLYHVRKKPLMCVIPQGIKETFFSIHCSKNSTTILSVGAIGERKGHLLTLKAFEQLRRGGVRARLVIAGVVSNYAYYNKLREVAFNSEFKEDIVLYVNVSDMELMELYKSSHVFVLHSEEESQGIVFAEAMATGMPVVSTTVGGIPYVVENRVTGLLSEFGNVETFTNHMALLMKDFQLWQMLSDNAIRHANSYHWESICKRVLDLYDKS